MKMIRQPLILAVSLAAALALSACGKSDDAVSQIPASAPPTAETMAPPAAAPATVVSVSSVELGSTVDDQHRILASGTTFAPKDTVYASVETTGSGDAMLAVKWIYQDGQVVREDSKNLAATGPETTAFMISRPSGFPAGSYKVEVSLNGTQVVSKDFAVK